MHTLPLYKTQDIDKLAWPDVKDNPVTLRSSALSIFTDFHYYPPLVVGSEEKALDIEKQMQRSHVKMKLVLDSNDHFIGIVTLADLNAQKIMQQVAQGADRDALRAIDFMQPRSVLQAFEFESLVKATVGDIIKTLENNGQHHCLVISQQAHEIRGVISVSDIARRLKVPINIQKHPTFSKLSRMLAA